MLIKLLKNVPFQMRSPSFDAKAAVEKIQAEEPMKFHFETEYEAKVSLEKLVALGFLEGSFEVTSAEK